jgi:hypothetical protein
LQEEGNSTRIRKRKSKAMLEVEALRTADAYEWLGTGIAASEYLKVHQTTTSRTVRQVNIAEAKLVAIGAQDLLDAERRIHQTLRFKQGRHLRLHLYQWANKLVHKEIPANWEVNPIRTSATKAPAINLLEKRVIDAVCAPYPLIANASKHNLSIIPLYTSFLQLLSNKGAVITRESNLSGADIASLSKLGKLDFVPTEASVCSEILDAEIFAKEHLKGRERGLERRYWGTPLTTFTSKTLQPVSRKPICPYAEYLVVLKEWENSTLVCKLHESITGAIMKAVSGDPVIELIKVAK